VGLALYCWVLFALDGYQAVLPRAAGMVLLGLLAVYLYLSARWGKAHPGHLEDNVPVEAEVDAAPGRSVFRLLGIGTLGLAGVLVGGELTIGSVSVIAERAGVPNAVIAGTLVAFGTSLPELMVAFTAIRRKHLDLLIGNVLGADILNALFVTGAAALAAPLPITEVGSRNPLALLQLGLPALVLILVAFRGMACLAQRRGHFSRWMGVPVFLIYLAYLLASFLWQPGAAGH
jgi:cation:H+ antiporter